MTYLMKLTCFSNYFQYFEPQNEFKMLKLMNNYFRNS